jgi:phosphopantetheinyl transferase (holo-ACP synthase)
MNKNKWLNVQSSLIKVSAPEYDEGLVTTIPVTITPINSNIPVETTDKLAKETINAEALLQKQELEQTAAQEKLALAARTAEYLAQKKEAVQKAATAAAENEVIQKDPAYTSTEKKISQAIADETKAIVASFTGETAEERLSDMTTIYIAMAIAGIGILVLIFKK